jgi:hypothetical protein
MIRALLLLALAAPAMAQQQEKPPAEPAKERRPLNLRLDNPSSFATIAPAEKEPPKALPALGGDAKPVPQGKIRSDGSSGVYPKDSNPGN